MRRHPKVAGKLEFFCACADNDWGNQNEHTLNNGKNCLTKMLLRWKNLYGGIVLTRMIGLSLAKKKI